MTDYKAITENKEVVLRGEKFVKGLLHVYDPVKAHEYYERTKHLKGRIQGRKSTKKFAPAVIEAKNRQDRKQVDEAINKLKKVSPKPGTPEHELLTKLMEFKEMLRKAKYDRYGNITGYDTVVQKGR